MYLYANGCSMTYGSELNDDSATGACVDDAYRWGYSWPGRLRGLLDTGGVFNDAVPSGSNDRVLRTTIAFVSDWLRLGLPARALAVVIGWSHPARREFFVDGRYRQVVPHHYYDIRALDRLVAQYRAAVDIEAEAVDRYTTQVAALRGFLTQHGVQYLFFNAIAAVELPERLRGGPVEEVFTGGRFLDWGTARSTMADFLRQRPNAWNVQHPNETGHRLWAERIAEELDPSGFASVTAEQVEAVGLPVIGGVKSDRRHDRKGTERIGRYIRARLIGFRIYRSGSGTDPFIYP